MFRDYTEYRSIWRFIAFGNYLMKYSIRKSKQPKISKNYYTTGFEHPKLRTVPEDYHIENFVHFIAISK